MRPFIILEGPDGTGKTYLAKEISERLGYTYEHTPAPSYEARDYLNDKLDKYKDGGAVLDRFHIGGFVFGNLFRNHDDLTPYDYWQIEGRLMYYNSMLIFAFSPSFIETITTRNDAATDTEAALYEDPSKQEEVARLYSFYVETLNNLPFVGYDFKEEDAVDSMVADVASLEEYWHDSPMPVSDSGSKGFGNQYSPKFCFVGSDPHPMLFKGLRAVGIPLNHICVISELSDSFVPSEYWLSTEMVALGYRGANKLKELGIPYRVVPHPVEVYNQHYKDVNTYGETLIGDRTWPYSSPASNLVIAKSLK